MFSNMPSTRQHEAYTVPSPSLPAWRASSSAIASTGASFCSGVCKQPCTCLSPSRVPRITLEPFQTFTGVSSLIFSFVSVSLFLALPQGSCHIKQLQLFLKIGLFAEWGVSGQIKTSSENRAFQWGTKQVQSNWLKGELQPTSQATKLLGFTATIVTRLFIFRSTPELRKWV